MLCAHLDSPGLSYVFHRISAFAFSAWTIGDFRLLLAASGNCLGFCLLFYSSCYVCLQFPSLLDLSLLFFS